MILHKFDMQVKQRNQLLFYAGSFSAELHLNFHKHWQAGIFTLFFVPTSIYENEIITFPVQERIMGNFENRCSTMTHRRTGFSEVFLRLRCIGSATLVIGI
jgi:hypothetical protein